MTKRDGLSDEDWAFLDWLRANPRAWVRYAGVSACALVMTIVLTLVDLPTPPIPNWVETAPLVLSYVVAALGAFLAVLTRALVGRIDEIDDREKG